MRGAEEIPYDDQEKGAQRIWGVLQGNIGDGRGNKNKVLGRLLLAR